MYSADPFIVSEEAQQNGMDFEGTKQDDALDLDALIRKNIADVVNEVVPRAIQNYFDEHIDKTIDRAVSKAVDRCFTANFARLTAMTGVLNKTDARDETIVEQHSPVDTEEQLINWNASLSDATVRKKYVSASME